ncbi:MAG: OmpA family protein [Polyangiaceae bacterium]
MSSDDQDKLAIMRRRAVFVTTALAALSCSSQQSGTGDSSASTTASATATATTTVSATASNTASSSAIATASNPKPRSFKASRDAAPPLEVAAALPEAERKDLEEVAKFMKPLYDKLAAAYEGAPVDCAPSANACSSTWESTAKAIGELRDMLDLPHCGFGEPVAYVQRFMIHRGYLLTLADALEKELGAAAGKFGQSSRWKELEKLTTAPQVCLKCAPPKPVAVLESMGDAVEVRFDDAKDSLPASADSELDQLKSKLDADTTLKLEIRGHADPNEAGDKKALAQHRAEAVRDALVKKGIAKNRLKVVNFGGDLPIANSGIDAGRARNRRVDFNFSVK